MEKYQDLKDVYEKILEVYPNFPIGKLAKKANN
jgi:hypothetical protein